MQVVSDETPLFTRWHYLYAKGYNPIRSKVSPVVIDMYDKIYAKHKTRFCHLFAFALYAIKHPSRQNSKFVISHQVPVDFPMPTGEPLEILNKLKKEALKIQDQAIPKITSTNVILLGMGGTRRFIELMYAVPKRAKVLIGRYGMGPNMNTQNTRIRGETGYESAYFSALEHLKKTCYVEAFTLNPRYFQTDKSSHAVTRRSAIKASPTPQIVYAKKYEDEAYASDNIECDPFTTEMLQHVPTGTHMNDLKLAWIANHWEDTVKTLRATFQIKECFLERSYGILKGNHYIPDQMKHIGHHTVQDRMLVYHDRARIIDSVFRKALDKGIGDLKITACTVNPGPANVPKALHGGNPFEYQDIDDMLALQATWNIVRCRRI